MDSPRTVGNFEDDDDDQIIIEEVKHEADDDDCVEYLLEDHIEYLPNDDEDDDDDGGLIVEEIVVDHQPEVFHCNSCDTQFQSVEKHIQEFHADEDVHIEESDGIMLERNDEDDEEDEINTKLISTEYVCSVCTGTFVSRKALNGHMNSHKPRTGSANTSSSKGSSAAHFVKPNKSKTNASSDTPSDELLNYVCKVCNTTFMSSKSLKLHLRMHLPAKTKTLQQVALQQTGIEGDEDPDVVEKSSIMFYCEICEKDYDLEFKDIHKQSHNGHETFRCRTCNISFANQSLLDMHMAAKQTPRVIQTKAAKNNIRLPYACQYCSKEFARPYEKVKHERIHTGEKPYACEICGKTFRVSYCLTLHMRTHTDARPYVCPHCNKRYKAPSVYNHHLLTHSDVRAFQCPYCPKAFKTHVQLSGHKNSHVKPFACTECNRPFATLYAVKAHMESHKRPQNNMKHSCVHCGASYTRAFALKNHVTEQHADAMVQQHDAAVLETIGQMDDDEDSQTDLYIMNMEEDGDGVLDDLVEEVTIMSENESFVKEEVVTDWFK